MVLLVALGYSITVYRLLLHHSFPAPLIPVPLSAFSNSSWSFLWALSTSLPMRSFNISRLHAQLDVSPPPPHLSLSLCFPLLSHTLALIDDTVDVFFQTVLIVVNAIFFGWVSGHRSTPFFWLQVAIALVVLMKELKKSKQKAKKELYLQFSVFLISALVVGVIFYIAELFVFLLIVCTSAHRQCIDHWRACWSEFQSVVALDCVLGSRRAQFLPLLSPSRKLFTMLPLSLSPFSGAHKRTCRSILSANRLMGMLDVMMVVLGRYFRNFVD